MINYIHSYEYFTYNMINYIHYIHSYEYLYHNTYKYE